MAKAKPTIDGLTAQERLDLLDEIWESLSRDERDLPVTPAQAAELDRRSRELDDDIAASRGTGIPWDEVMRRIQARAR